MARKKLGEMLIEAGVLDDARLRSALADQRRWGRPLGRTLVEMRLIEEDELVRVLAAQLGMSTVDLDALDIPFEITSMIPDEIARRHQVVAFAQPMKVLDIAMVDPTNLGVLDELRIRCQLNIRPYLAGPHQLERALARYHGGAEHHDASIPLDGYDMLEPLPSNTPERLDRAPPRGSAPRAATANRDAEIDALQVRLQRLEALVARDEEVLRKLLALLVDKGVATRDEILERLG
jgi:hypothetical protein